MTTTQPDEWVSVARSTIMSGLCVDWYRTTDRYEHGHPWTVSASREGVLIHDGVHLHTIPAIILELASRAHELLRTGHDADREIARCMASHVDDHSRGIGRGRLQPRQQAEPVDG